MGLAWVRLCKSRAQALASGRGRRCKGFAFAAWFRVLLQHAGVVHPCTTRTRTPCIDVLRRVQVMTSVGYGNSISATTTTTTAATAAPVSLSNEATVSTWQKTW